MNKTHLITKILYTHFALDGRPWVVMLNGEILVGEIKEVFDIRIEFHHGQGARCTRELQLHLLQVVEIQMGVAGGMDKLARLQARDLCHHLQKKGIRGNVERHSEKGVCTALVELETQLAIGHIKLEKAVAWRQFHGLYVRHIPGTDNHAARVGIVLDLMKHLFDLVDMAAIVVLPCSPLTAIHRTEVAMLIGHSSQMLTP